MEQEMQNLQYQMQLLTNKIESMDSNMVVANSNLLMMMQSINMQIQSINETNRAVASLVNKMSDMEINSTSADEYLKEVLDSQRSLSIELQEIKQAIEGVRFYAFNQGSNPNF